MVHIVIIRPRISSCTSSSIQLAHARQSGAELLQQRGLLSDRDTVRRRQDSRRRGKTQIHPHPVPKVEQTEIIPTAATHLCAPPPSASLVDTICCFALGGAT